MSTDGSEQPSGRFTKRSTRLVLENGVDMPAGCGGIVMRWVDPNDGIPLRIRAAAHGRVTLFADGQQLALSRLRVTSGPFVLGAIVTLELEADDPFFDWFQLECSESTQGQAANQLREILRTQDDGQWRCTTSPPDDAWLQPHYDYADVPWQPMAASATARSALDGFTGLVTYKFRMMDHCAALSTPRAETVWIRREWQLG